MTKVTTGQTGDQAATTLYNNDVENATNIALKVNISDIDTTVTGTAGKVADAGAFKKVNDNFQITVTPATLFNGPGGDVALGVSVNEGASKIWVAANKCAIVPVTPGHTVRVAGRTGQTIALTCLWLLTNDHTLGATPTYLTGDFAGSTSTGDNDKVVPVGAAYLYVLLDFPKALTLVVTDLTAVSAYSLKDAALPPDIPAAIAANTAATAALKIAHVFVTTKYTDVAIGRDCNLYYASITNEPDYGSPNQITSYSNSFTILLRGVKNLKYDPLAAQANFDANLALRDYNFNQVSSQTKTFRTIAHTAGGGAAKRLMMLGDSYVNIGQLSREVWSLLRADADYALTILGTRTPQFVDSNGYKNEGYSGWAWNNFVNLDSAPVSGVSTVNPFRTAGALNIPAYFTANAYTGIDIMIINLGINDFNFVNTIITDAQIATVIAQAKTFMAAVLAYAPACKIILTLPTIGGMQDYQQTQSQQSYRKYNCQRGALAYIANFDNGAFNANVVLSDAGQWIDRTNGWATTVANSATRLPGITEAVATDPVHPQSVGFLQMADGVYSKIRSVLAGNAG